MKRKFPVGPGSFLGRLCSSSAESFKNSNASAPSPKLSGEAQGQRSAQEGGFGTWGLSPLGCDALNFVSSGPVQGASRRAQIWRKPSIFVLGGPLPGASKALGPDFAQTGYFCIKRPFTDSFKERRVLIWRNLAIFGLNGSPRQ